MQNVINNIDWNKAGRISGIIVILIMLCIVFKTTILKAISSIKGFIKRNTPSFDFLFV
mgnify:FL=1